MTKPPPDPAPSSSTPPAGDFIRTIVAADRNAGKHGGTVVTRFPPEPNGHLHIGHAKSICLNFGVALENDGRCNLRFDDTNPTRENTDYVESIKRDVEWLGFDWSERAYYASDYFEQLYDYAVHLIRAGKAYVCSLSAEQIRAYRGTLTEPGRDSPYRNRTVEENLDLFTRMRAGECAEGSHVLRAKIDMAAPNVTMRDPTLYRILHVPHHRTGDRWCLYPMYDFTHCLSDAIEGVTHSLCTLEFEDHRPLYDWVLDQLPVPSRPRQIEFARLNLTHTVLSKRKLLQLASDGHVDGWDDPRMPTLAGLRRRGYTPGSIRTFCARIGLAKRNSTVDFAMLEHCVREELNRSAPRAMAVLRPLRVVIDNYPEGRTEQIKAVNNPEDARAGTRRLPFSRVLYIEREDFMEDPPRKFFRLAPGREVRLRYAYIVECVDVVKDASGHVTEIHCRYDPETRSGGPAAHRKVKATIHWVSAKHALTAQVRLYDHLFVEPDPDTVAGEKPFTDSLNPRSLEVLHDCQVEPGLADAAPGSRVQFERQGYFCVDTRDSAPGRPVFNRTVGLRDTWARVQKARSQRGS